MSGDMMRGTGALSPTTILRGSVAFAPQATGTRPGAGPSLVHARRRRKRPKRSKDANPPPAVAAAAASVVISGTDTMRRDHAHLCYYRGSGARLLDPSCELEVLKCIMLREGYLARVTQLAEDMARKAKRSHGKLQTLPPGLSDLLDLLRMATLDSVEAISLWRLSQADPTPRPFLWNNHNYLLKILHDCDFLNRVETLRRWLGFRLSRNPFFVPCDPSGDENVDIEATNNAVADFQFDQLGLADVGLRPWCGPLEIPTTQDRVCGNVTKVRSRTHEGRNSRRRGDHGNLAPYAAAVVNDPALLSNETSPTRSMTAPRESKARKAGNCFPLTTLVDVKGLTPNFVSREDVIRIRAARQTLVEEEKRVLGDVAEARTGRGGIVAIGERVTRSSCSKVSRTSLVAEADFRGKRASYYGGHEGEVGPRKRSILAWQSDPTAVEKTRNAAKEDRNVRSLTLTAAGLLQREHPEAHQGLGPVLLRSNRPGGDEHRKPFVHTVSKESLGYDFTDTPGLDHSAANTIGAIETTHSTTPQATPHSTSGWAEGRHQRHDNPISLLLTPRAMTSPIPTPFAVDATTVENGFPDSIRSNGSADRKYTTRRSQKAGAELRALTAAGTTGRRKPPPREIRLRRLARDVNRHSAELRDLETLEKCLRRDLSWLDGSTLGANKTSVVEERPQRFARNEDFAGENQPPDNDTVTKETRVTVRKYGERVPVGNISGTKEDDDACEPEKGSGTCISSERLGNDDKDVGDALLRTRSSALEHMDSSGDTMVGAKVASVTAEECRSRLERVVREIALKAFDLAVKRDELACLCAVQKQERERKRALDMERRRARLRMGQTLPEDDAVAETLEDRSAIAVQRRYRGIRGRQYAAWYKNNIHQAAMTIQQGMRYVWDRRATARRLLLQVSARPLQATVRMFIARKRYMWLLRQKKELSACKKLQKTCRGMRGRRRAAARRAMVEAAAKAVEWVSLEKLQPSDLKELGMSIHGALVDPMRELPPPGVLGILRVALTVLDEPGVANGTGGNNDTVKFQTALGRTVRGAVSAPDLTWEMAARVLGRPFRLLRRMRAFASGLGAPSDRTPTRLLRIPPCALQLMDAYRGDPAWSEDALRASPAGGKAAVAFVGWARELGKVYREQPYVETFLRDAQPAWLRKSRVLQKRRRALELLTESCRAAVSTARARRQDLKIRGRAYGAPVVALEELETRLQTVERALLELESRRNDFLVWQTAAEEAKGQALREDAEFAEREASVMARAEEMARRTGQGGPEAVFEIETKRMDCEVIVRELKRRVRVWERRCDEENGPLLEEWVPPTATQVGMARTLGDAKADIEFLRVQKTMIVEQAGGRRFIKGLIGGELEAWKRVAEGFQACREDVRSGESRLGQEVLKFELNIVKANEKAAAENVCSTRWDNATEETKVLETKEDDDAAIDERRITMGATLPPGLLDITPSPSEAGKPRSYGPSQRPTLVLLGLDLPAAVRENIRASLDHNTPGMFGEHMSGVRALPSVVEAISHRRRGFLASSGESTGRLPSLSQGNANVDVDAIDPLVMHEIRQFGGDGDEYFPVLDQERTRQENTRACRVQAALFAGKNVSLDVVSGPGLWARGRFLRDLEAALGGIDGCGGHGRGESDERHLGPTVVLVRGHQKNRSGGGAVLGYGSRGAAANETPYVHGFGMGALATVLKEEKAAPGVAAVATHRAKSHLEVAAQCLHDLSIAHSRQPNPVALKPFTVDLFASPPLPVRTANRSGVLADVDHRTCSPHGSDNGAETTARWLESDEGLVILLAACQMLLRPFWRYGLEYDDVTSTLDPTSQQGSLTRFPIFATANDPHDRRSIIAYLAGRCSTKLAELQTAGELAALLRTVDLTSIPFNTAMDLRELVREKSWPSASPRTLFTGSFTLEVFSGWIVAAVSAATYLSLEGGGSDGKNKAYHNNPEATRFLEAMRLSEGEPARLRARETELLDKMEGLLVDEEITVMDDDSPWMPKGEQREGDIASSRHYCQSSEAFDTLMNVIVRPFKIHEESERIIPMTINGVSTKDLRLLAPSSFGATFHVSVSRAYGSVHVRAEPVGGRGTSGQRAAMTLRAKVQNDDLIRLLSPNWMEKHELSALRDLSSLTTVCRALLDTLVIQHSQKSSAEPKTAERWAQTSINVEHTDVPAGQHIVSPGEASSLAGERSRWGNNASSTLSSCVAGGLTFRHPRRLTLETTCLLMGCVVPVNVYEEGRSDFWCEARVPRSDVRTCTVGLSIPKECIPLLLDKDHPMHMRAILNAADMRELSSLIADRLKLSRVRSTGKNRRSYRYWLDSAIGCGDAGDQAVNKCQDTSTTGTNVDGTYRLSLRKRGVGQMVFSRIMSFWVLSEKASDERDADAGQSMVKLKKIVTIKELAHRGSCGELRVSVNDTDSRSRAASFVLPWEVTAMLLAGRPKEPIANTLDAQNEKCERGDRCPDLRSDAGKSKPPRFSSTPCWTRALTWRLRLNAVPRSNPIDYGGINTSSHRINGCSTLWIHRIGPRTQLAVDQRAPMLGLCSVPARQEVLRVDSREDSRTCLKHPKHMVDLLLLPAHCVNGDNSTPELEIVVTHLQTMAVFCFPVFVETIVNAISDLADACLVAPTALSSELTQSVDYCLRDVMGKWLSYSTSDGDGNMGTMTLTIPGVRAVKSNPYTALRDGGCGTGVGGIYTASETHREQQGGAAEPVMSQNIRRFSSLARECNGERENEKTNQMRTSDRTTNRGETTTCQQQRPSVATLAVETRNERMIFQRRLLVPLGRKVNSDSQRQLSGAENGRRANRDGTDRELRQEFVITIYEAFAGGDDGKVQRSLKFCARDETSRPAVETTTTVPWVGNCTAVEGGAIWRIVTEGLRCTRTTDERGRIVDIALQVSVLPGLENTEGWNECKVDGGIDKMHRDSPREELVLCRPGDMTKWIHTKNPFAHPVSDRNTAFASKLAHDNGEHKIYEGWHTIAGARLHVQCFQEGGGQALSGSDGIGDDSESRSRPAGRGGVVNLPRGASLRFVVCDPKDGRRNEVRVSVDDLMANSSIHGGIVADTLMDAGRRPVLARAIAQHLRLVFDAGGGYSVTLPLPPSWAQAKYRA